MKFEQRQKLAKNYNLPIQAVVKDNLYQVKNKLYTPQQKKLEGYGQYPRPKDKPYINQIDYTSEIQTKQMLPK